jgi:DNA ligase-1
MLAGRFVESKLRFPIICQPKLDGIRASVVNGKLVTRTLKPVPNAYTRSLFERPEYEGFDGELIVGEPTAYDCYRKTCSGVMSEAGTPSVTYYLFDVWNKQTPYALRWLALGAAAKAASPHSGRGPSPLHILTYSTVFDMEGLLNLEADWVGKGYEGVILRDPNTLYKFGRGSATKQELLKLKRYIDFEAEIIGVEEEQHNANEAKTNALGRTERSSAKAGKVGKGTMGKLRVRRLSTGVEFSVGTGFSAAERQWFWDRRGYSEAGGVVGKIVKIKSFPIGVKDLPRHPVFLGFRDKRDM